MDILASIVAVVVGCFAVVALFMAVGFFSKAARRHWELMTALDRLSELLEQRRDG